MTIEQLREMADKDLKIDGSELGEESIRIPQLHGKYLNFFHDETLVLRKQEMDIKTLYYNKWRWYNGKLSQDELKELGWEQYDHRILRNDLDIVMEADKDLQRLQAKISLQKAKVEYLDSIIKGILNRNWVIRNAIEWQKFRMGVG